MKSEDNVCAGCSTGCSIKIEQNQEHIYRLKPRENPHVNQWWMCDEGRYGWKHVHSNTRLTEPKAVINGKLSSIEWNQLPEHIHKSFQSVTNSAVVISPHLTVEEAYLLATYMKSLNSNVQLVLGPVPVEGIDESFKNGFTIRAEKCPNRRGVEKVLASVAAGAGFLTWDNFLAQLKAGAVPEAVWISGGYKTDWNTAEIAELFSRVKTLLVQDCFVSALWEKATIQLPGATFAEREGSYVNFNDHLQSFRWGVRPPLGVKSEGQLLWVLAHRKGLYNAKVLLAEIARECAYFSPVLNNSGECSVPETGIDLRVNQLAAST